MSKSKSKKRILAGIMSLLLVITTVFMGNVVTRAAEENTSSFQIRITPIEGVTSISYQIAGNGAVSIGLNDFMEQPVDESGTVWYTWNYTGTVAVGTTVALSVTTANGYSIEQNSVLEKSIVADDSNEFEVRLATSPTSDPGRNVNMTFVGAASVTANENGTEGCMANYTVGTENVSVNISKGTLTGNTLQINKNDIPSSFTFTNYNTGTMNAKVYTDEGFSNSIGWNSENSSAFFTGEGSVPDSFNFTIEASSQSSNNNGKIRFHCQDNPVTGGHVSVSFDGSEYVGVPENEDNSYGTIDLPQGVSNLTVVYFKFEENNGYSLDTGRGVAIWLDGESTPLTANAEGAYTYTLPDSPLEKQYELEFGWGSGNGGGGQQDVSFSCSDMNGKENERVDAVEVQKQGSSDWVAYSSGALDSLAEGDTFKVRIKMKENFTIDKVSLDYESFNHNSRVGYFKESDQPNYDAIIAALLSEAGYSITFQPEADSRNSDGQSTLQANSTCLRLQYQTALSYAENVDINMFFQTKDGDNGYGVWTRDDNGADVFVDGVGDSEVKFSFNGNNYGENGDPFGLGYGRENTGENPIQVSYVSAYAGKVGQTVTVTPETYDYFAAGGYATETNQNTIRIDDYDGLIDEVYIDVNGDNTFEAGEKLTPEVGEDAFIGKYSYYEKTLDASSSYNILVRKHLSTRVSLKWSYTESGTDFYVDHGDIFIEKVVRGDETLYQAQVNTNGDLVLDEQGVPIATIDLLGNDYGVSSSAGEVFLECGDEVTIRLIPTYGYQIESATLNGCVQLTPNEVVSSFTFTVGGNLHMAGTFIEATDVTDTRGATTVSDASITDGQNATDSGNLKLTVSDYDGTYENETAALDLARGDNAEAEAETIATLDMTLDSMVSKGNGEYWTENISEFDNPINVNLELNDDSYVEGDTYVVVREHEGELEPLETSYEDGVLSVPTEKFSTYSIIKISAAKEDRPDISLIDISTLKWTGTTFVYDGTAQGPAFSSTLPTGVVLESKTGASNTSAGNYSAVASLKLADGYSKEYYKLVNTSNTAGITVAADGATATVSQAWSITKAAPTITLSNLSETTKAPTGVKAAISPEDATAAVVIEYQVELSANGQTTKQWVKTRPTVAGTYPVRAYLPEGTTNLEAVTEANAVTGTYILTQYTAPTANEGKDVNTTDPASNALKANLAEDAKLADKVLTPKEQASGGTVSLTVQDITKTVSDADKTLVESNLGGATLGMYLDFDLTKVVLGQATPVTETIDAVKIRLTLPTSLINTDTTKVRTYQMIRVHDFGAGPVAETLPCTFDAATGTVSFDTKYFSTYALVYSDAAVPASPSDTPSEDTTVNTAVKDAVPKTGDAGSTVLWYAVAVISGLGAVYFGKKKKKYTK